MVRWYINRIQNGKMTLNEVPKRWFNEVKNALEHISKE